MTLLEENNHGDEMPTFANYRLQSGNHRPGPMGLAVRETVDNSMWGTDYLHALRRLRATRMTPFDIPVQLDTPSRTPCL